MDEPTQNVAIPINSVARLPTETMVFIFEYLREYKRVQLENVCQRWRLISRDHGWVNFKMFSPNGNSRFYALDKNDEAEDEEGPSAKKSRVNEEPSDSFLFTIAQRGGKYIEEIHIKNPFGCGQSVLESADFWKQLSALKVIHFEWGVRQNPYLSRALLDALSGNVPGLKSLCIDQNTFEDDPTPHVEHFLMLDALEGLFRAHPAIEFLSLHMKFARGLRCLPTGLKMLDLFAILQYSNREFNLLTFGDDAGNQLLMEHQEMLRVEQFVELAARQCPGLEALQLPICYYAHTNKTLNALANFESLRILRLDSFSMEFDLLIDVLQQNKLGQLRGLLINSQGQNGAQHFAVDNLLLSSIIEFCPLLEYLDFGYDYVPDGPNPGLRMLPALKMLRSLAIYSPNIMNENLLVAMLGEMQKLEFFDFRGRNIFSTEIVMNFIRAGKTLKRLSCQMEVPKSKQELANRFQQIGDCVKECRMADGNVAPNQHLTKDNNKIIFQMHFYTRETRPYLMRIGEEPNFYEEWSAKGIDFTFGFQVRNANNPVHRGIVEGIVPNLPRNIEILGN